MGPSLILHKIFSSVDGERYIIGIKKPSFGSSYALGQDLTKESLPYVKRRASSENCANPNRSPRTVSERPQSRMICRNSSLERRLP